MKTHEIVFEKSQEIKELVTAIPAKNLKLKFSYQQKLRNKQP